MGERRAYQRNLGGMEIALLLASLEDDPVPAEDVVLRQEGPVLSLLKPRVPQKPLLLRITVPWALRSPFNQTLRCSPQEDPCLLPS